MLELVVAMNGAREVVVESDDPGPSRALLSLSPIELRLVLSLPTAVKTTPVAPRVPASHNAAIRIRLLTS